jgi:hypothetical protein
MSRLGLISSANCPQEEVIDAANRIRRATGEKLSVIDQVFYTYGSSDHGRVRKAICGNKPICNQCYLTHGCAYYKSLSEMFSKSVASRI